MYAADILLLRHLLYVAPFVAECTCICTDHIAECLIYMVAQKSISNLNLL